MKVLNQANIKTTDYVVAFNVNKAVAKSIYKTSKGLVLSGKYSMKECRYVKNISDLEEDAFDKVIVFCKDKLPVKLHHLVKITENLGFVLIKDLDAKNSEFVRRWLGKNGIFDMWHFRKRKSEHSSILFKVKKW